MKAVLVTLVAIGLATTAHAGETMELTAPGPEGDLAGTLIAPADGKPTLLIIPGSGPTDRDGNNPAGVTAGSYRLLVEALGEQGIGSLRIDKRGMFGSKAATTNPNDVTVSAYASDVAEWVNVARETTGADCIWLLGHSEGGLIALEAVQKGEGICGVLLVAAPGRPMGDILRQQLLANPANVPIMNDALSAIAALEKGERVSTDGMNPALMGLFAPAVQGFLIDLMSRDPAAMAGRVALPMVIVSGGKDIQTQPADAEALMRGQPTAKLVRIADMNHVLKAVQGESRAANLATYSDSSLPIHPELVAAVSAFVIGTD
ncbi:MAG: alpha/beta fold hydrolase [Pseudomonadota bacterium]